MTNSRGPSRQITVAQVRGVLLGLQDANKLPATPSEITEALDKDTTPKTVNKRLNELHENGEVSKHESGPGFVWDLSPEELNADADLTNRIAGVLQSAELEDIPTDQARWIAESLPVEKFSEEKKMDLVEAVDPELLSDDKILEILEPTDPHLIPENKIKQIIDSVDLDVEDFPDGIAEAIVSERYGYEQSYWADLYRSGVRHFARAGMTTVIGFITILASLQIGPYDFPGIYGFSIPTIVINSEVIGAFLFLFGLLFFVFGLSTAIIGFLGQEYSSVEDPRPWGDYIKGILSEF